MYNEEESDTINKNGWGDLRDCGYDCVLCPECDQDCDDKCEDGEGYHCRRYSADTGHRGRCEIIDCGGCACGSFHDFY